jgi:hypothetical protein
MHAGLFHIYNHAFYFIYVNYYLSSRIGHDLVSVTLFKQRLIYRHAYIIHSAISCFHV